MRLEEQLDDLPEGVHHVQAPNRPVYKTPERVVQAAMAMAFSGALVAFCLAMAWQLFRQLGSFDFRAALQASLFWAFWGVVGGAVIGAIEFRFLRKGRRE